MKTVEPGQSVRPGPFFSVRTLILTLLFGGGLLVFEFLALPRSRISLQALVRHLSAGDHFRFWGVLALSITAFGIFLVFVYAAFSSRTGYRIFYFAVFSLLTLTQYGYYRAFGAFPGFEEIEVALFSPNWEIFTGAVLTYFNFLALIPIIIFGLFLLKTSRASGRSLSAAVLLVISLALFGGFFGATTYLTKNTYYVHSFNHGLRSLISLPVIWYVGTINDTPKNSHYYGSREKIEYRSAAAPKNNIVLIIDESVRSDHLSLNGYSEPTTPTLEKLSQRGFIRNFGTAVAGTTCSVTSNALLLTGLHDLPDREFRVFKLPTIFQYARAMNYRTHYFDGQARTLWNGKPADVVDFGNWVTSTELNKNLPHKYETDAEIARRVREIVNNSTGNFIWINKYGVHQSYINSYPDNRGTAAERYDQALRYNSESFFGELANDVNFGKNAVYLYTSDHGRNLGENGATATHCSDTRPEADVPLFLMSSPENLPETDTAFKASHANIFATVLDLMEFPAESRRYGYALSLFKAKSADSPERFYFVGDLHLSDEGKKYPFDERSR